jgi:hemerythrin superfamily protein
MSCTAPVLGFGAMRAYPRQRRRKTFPENAPVFLHRRAPTFDSEQGAWGLHGVRDMFGRMPAVAGSDQLKPTENDMFGFNDANQTPDAIELLKQDHDEVEAMFKEYEDLKDGGRPSEKEDLAQRICDALTVHATIEEEIFYPTVRRERGETGDLVDEARVEHQSLKDIIGRLQAAPPSDPLYDAGVKVLSEYVKHHVREEENELFPKVRRLDLDLDALGGKLKARKDELMSQPAQVGNGKGRQARQASRAQ